MANWFTISDTHGDHCINGDQLFMICKEGTLNICIWGAANSYTLVYESESARNTAWTAIKTALGL